MLAAYHWPATFAICTTIERALVLGSSKFIQPEDLPAKLQPKNPADVTGESLNARNFAFKIKLIERTLVETDGNVARASRILELSVRYMHFSSAMAL